MLDTRLRPGSGVGNRQTNQRIQFGTSNISVRAISRCVAVSPVWWCRCRKVFVTI